MPSDDERGNDEEGETDGEYVGKERKTDKEYVDEEGEEDVRENTKGKRMKRENTKGKRMKRENMKGKRMDMMMNTIVTTNKEQITLMYGMINRCFDRVTMLIIR
ncbi:hypothetical protein RhiirC2_830354 [Rhizophagus irregularis]|uniref:Uncharacterized protein n=1 Tax=Rhizophagus irregularis TaxID=588596 RepID=A0A2N1M397_9GLOM|nr:hypothetical protein RhiirC2_830354 [Rhizophagus irregularis]